MPQTAASSTEIIGGRFTILASAGVGGMGSVYKAHDRMFDQVVALKMLFPHLMQNAELLTRFRNEVLIARRLTHPNIIRTYNFDAIDGHYFLTMEFVDGRSLAETIAPAGIAPDDALRIICRTLRALAHAHAQGVIHCDLKPANILMTDSGEPKIADFGISQLLHHRGQSQLAIVGTPLYMAPEQLDGGRVDCRTDLYSLGSLAYELLTGHPPFTGTSLFCIAEQHRSAERSPIVRDGVPPALAKLVLRMIAADPSDRPLSAADALSSLADLVPADELALGEDASHPAIPLVPAILPPRPSWWARQNRWTKLAILILVLVLGLRFGKFVVDTNDATRRRLQMLTLRAERLFDTRFTTARSLFRFRGLDGHSQEELAGLIRGGANGRFGPKRNAAAIYATITGGLDLSYTDAQGNSYLHIAVTEGTGGGRRVIQLLVSYGLSVNTKNTLTGDSPLYVATLLGRSYFIEDLLALGADPDLQNFRGRAPLHLVAGSGNNSIVMALLTNGANPNIKNVEGTTPLHEAVRAGNATGVEMLLHRRADPLAMNAQGETPLSMAREMAAAAVKPDAARILGAIERRLGRAADGSNYERNR